MYVALKIGTFEESIGPRGRPSVLVDVRQGVPTLEQMQEIVGGYITTGFRLLSATRPHVQIDYYVDDEGLCKSDLPVLAYAVEDYEEYPTLAGDGVFVGGDTRDGETIALTQAEVDQVDAVKVKFLGWTSQ